MSSECNLDKEIDSRISKASKSFSRLSRLLWYQRNITLKNKLRTFKAKILPTLLYGCETWAPTSTHLKRLQGFVMRCLRIILGISLRDRLRSTDIRRKAGMLTVESMIRQR